jgi:pectinesterase
LPNFAERLELDVVNDGDAPVDTLAVVSIADASRTALRFPGTLAIVVVPGSPESAAAPSFLPSQIDDLDGNGTADELVFPIALGAKESRRVHVYYSVTLRDELPWPKRVHASHAFGYNRATAALESEVIGYRTYGGFFLDVQGRAEGHAGLHNTLLGYAGSWQATSAGRDVIHLGDTLGLGGLFLRSGATTGATAGGPPGGTVVRPPLNVPDYAHKPSPPDVPIYRVIASGPLRAIVEAHLDRWRVSESETVSARATYTITAGAAHVECRFQITPVRIDREYEVGAGVRHLPAMSSDHDRAAGRLALAGTESAAIGPLGLALYYDPASAAAAPALVTKEASNDIVVFRDRLAPGRAVEGRYWMAAAWSGSGSALGRDAGDLLPYLRRVEQQARAAVRVSNLRHARTPNPDAIEGEAH